MLVTSHHTRGTHAAQPGAAVTDPWTTEVVPGLPPDLAPQAAALGALQRQRTFTSASDLLRAFLAYVLCAPSFAALGVWGVLQDVADISTTAWRKRLRCASPWLAWLLSTLLASPPATLPLARQRRIRLVDATRLKHWRGSGDDWRLHLSYDLGAGRMDQVVVTDRHGAESVLHAALQPGDIIVADAGSGSSAQVARLVTHQADGIVRIYPRNFPVEDQDGQPMDIATQLPGHGPAVHSLACWCRSGTQRYAIRLVVVALPPEIAAAKRRKRQAQAVKTGKPVSAQALFYLGSVVLITTLDATWTDAAVLRRYRARWQIELVFKRIKQLLRAHCIRSSSVASAEATVRALLVAWALQERAVVWLRGQVQQIQQELQAARLPRLPGAVVLADPAISSWLLTQLCLETIRRHVGGSWCWERVVACLPRLVRFLCPSPRKRVHQETVLRAWLRQAARTMEVRTAAAA